MRITVATRYGIQEGLNYELERSFFKAGGYPDHVEWDDVRKTGAPVGTVHEYIKGESYKKDAGGNWRPVRKKMSDTVESDAVESNLSFDCYPPEAFAFVSESLWRAVEDVHGPASPALAALSEIMAANGIGADELEARYSAGTLTPAAAKLVEDAGGPRATDRHIGGGDLCLSLRRIAAERWGLLARAVLASWNITRTIDFGRIVTEMVEKGFMSSKPDDALEDFADVYDFGAIDDAAAALLTPAVGPAGATTG